MGKKLILSLGFMAASLWAAAQDEFDALRYSANTVLGTARNIGLSGAAGSMGGDFSCLSVNPAGIGVYKSNEFMISSSLSTSSNQSDYLTGSSSAMKTSFHIPNFGLVVTNNLQENSYKNQRWKSVSFGVGMNRLSSFKNEYVYSGTNYQNSLTERFADSYNELGGLNSQTLAIVNYSAYAAYQTYLVDRGLGADSNMAVSYVPYKTGINQTKRVNERGALSEYVISVGGNYEDKLLVGATLGIPVLRYNRTLQFNEEDATNDLTNNFRYMHYTENLKTEGTGINLKLGAIYKFSRHFRMGLAIHTPTHYELTDISSISMESHTDSLLLYNNPGASPISQYAQDSALTFNYTLTTPFKALGSACLLFGKYGLLTADLEYVHYPGMKYNFGIDYSSLTSAINQVIDNTYMDAVNVRIGGEARLDKVSLRAGFHYQGSPYQDSRFGGAATGGSLGIGYREQYWFIDAGFDYTYRESGEYPYQLKRSNAYVQMANIANTGIRSVVTLGVKF